MRPAQHGAGERTLQEWPLASGEVLRLRVCSYKSRDYLDLRRWYVDEGGELQPTQRGVRVNVELAPALA